MKVEAAGMRSKKSCLEGMNPLGMDVFSSDGRRIGRVTGFVQEALRGEHGKAEGFSDLFSEGRDHSTDRRILIDSQGSIAQAQITVPIHLMAIDWRASRVNLSLSLSQIERAPHHRSNA